MIVKHAHQADMIDEILLSEMKLRKKTMNDDKNFSEAEKNDYLINEEQKLMNCCHFDYKEITKKAAKKTAMKKAKKTDQKRYKMSKQRSARMTVSR